VRAVKHSFVECSRNNRFNVASVIKRPPQKDLGDGSPSPRQCPANYGSFDQGQHLQGRRQASGGHTSNQPPDTHPTAAA
jgi:hypothetical protein